MRLTQCLNPYSIGIWSATMSANNLIFKDTLVLILILLEYGLRQFKGNAAPKNMPCLNPYSIGIWSATTLQFSENMGIES